MASCLRSPSSSMPLREGRCSSLKWSSQSRLSDSRRSKSFSLLPLSSMTSSRLRLVVGDLLRGRSVVGIDRRLVGGVAQLQNGIFLQFLLDALLQGHDGQLQDFHRLNHARSQDHSLGRRPGLVLCRVAS